MGRQCTWFSFVNGPAAATSIHNLSGINGAQHHVTPFHGLSRLSFFLREDIRCSERISAAYYADPSASVDVELECLCSSNLASLSSSLSAPSAGGDSLEAILSSSNPRGPVYISTASSYARWSAIAQRVLDSPGHDRVIAVDLEGDLRINGFAELIQLCVAREPDQPTASSCIAVIDLRLFRDGLSRDSLVRAWLQDPGIIKLFHNCLNDGACLHGVHGITVANMFDSVVADSLIRSLHHNTARGLATVLHEYTGVHIPKDVEHCPSTWIARPLTPKLMEYAALDVTYGPLLYHALADRCNDLGLLPLVSILSSGRTPPISLKVTHPLHVRPTHLLVAAHDGTNLVCLLEPGTNALALPTRDNPPFLSGPEPWRLSRAAAVTLFADVMGKPIAPIKKCVNSRLSKPIRLGHVLAYEARFSLLYQDCVNSLQASFRLGLRTLTGCYFE